MSTCRSTSAPVAQRHPAVGGSPADGGRRREALRRIDRAVLRPTSHECRHHRDLQPTPHDVFDATRPLPVPLTSPTAVERGGGPLPPGSSVGALVGSRGARCRADHGTGERQSCAPPCNSSTSRRRALGPDPHTLTTRLQAHLQLPPDDDVPNTAFSLPVVEHANLQLALDELAAARSFEVLGLPPDIGHYGGLSLAGMAAGHWHGPGRAERPLVRRRRHRHRSAAAVLPRLGLVLTEHGGRPLAVLLYLSERGPMPEVHVEVVAADATTLGEFVATVHASMEAHNVIRGKVMAFSFGRYGEFGIAFIKRGPVGARAGDSAPAYDLDALDRHCMGISERAAEPCWLRRPPPAGGACCCSGRPAPARRCRSCTCSQPHPERTTLFSAGWCAGALGQAAAIARSLQPSMIVLEDVDLIAMERTMPGRAQQPPAVPAAQRDGRTRRGRRCHLRAHHQPGRAARAGAGRPARAHRPDHRGQAAGGRGAAPAALRAVLCGASNTASTTSTAWCRATKGVSASFIKELARRAVLATLQRGGTPGRPARGVRHRAPGSASPRSCAAPSPPSPRARATSRRPAWSARPSAAGPRSAHRESCLPLPAMDRVRDHPPSRPRARNMRVHAGVVAETRTAPSSTSSSRRNGRARPTD